MTQEVPQSRTAAGPIPTERIGPYCIQRLIGQGGIASVYLAKHERLRATYALKVLHVRHPGFAERLLREGKLMSAAGHPNVVRVFDVLEYGGCPVLVMEYVDGCDLHELITLRGRLRLPHVQGLMTGILLGARAAHAAGSVHRDLKPSNILLATEDGRTKICDFGLAKLVGPRNGPALTLTGVPFGTPPYMAPEQFDNAPEVDVRADIFSLGCILYEMLAGCPAFEGDTLERTLVPLAERRPDTPTAWLSIVQGCLVPDREKRIADCDTLLRRWNDEGGSSGEGVSTGLDTSDLRIEPEELAQLRAPGSLGVGRVVSHVPPDRLIDDHRTAEEAAHLAFCPQCQEEARRLWHAQQRPARPDMSAVVEMLTLAGRPLDVDAVAAVVGADPRAVRTWMNEHWDEVDATEGEPCHTGTPSAHGRLAQVLLAQSPHDVHVLEQALGHLRAAGEAVAASAVLVRVAGRVADAGQAERLWRVTAQAEGEPCWVRAKAIARAHLFAYRESHGQALEAFKRLLEDVDAHDPMVVELRLGEAFARLALGDHTEAGRLAGALLEDARRWERPDGMMGASVVLARCAGISGDAAEVQRLAREGLQLEGNTHRAALLFEVALVQMADGGFVRARHALEKADKVIGQAGGHFPRTALLTALCTLLLWDGEFIEARQLALEAQGLADRRGVRSEQGAVRIAKASAAMHVGLSAEATATLRDAAVFVAGTPRALLACLLAQARLELDAQQVSEALMHASHGLRVAALIDPDGVKPMLHAFVARAVAQRTPQEARSHLRLAVANLTTLAPPFRAQLQVAVAYARLALGDREAACDAASDALQIANARGYRPLSLEAHALLASLAAPAERLTHRDLAQQLVRGFTTVFPPDLADAFHQRPLVRYLEGSQAALIDATPWDDPELGLTMVLTTPIFAHDAPTMRLGQGSPSPGALAPSARLEPPRAPTKPHRAARRRRRRWTTPLAVVGGSVLVASVSMITTALGMLHLLSQPLERIVVPAAAEPQRVTEAHRAATAPISQAAASAAGARPARSCPRAPRTAAPRTTAPRASAPRASAPRASAPAHRGQPAPKFNRPRVGRGRGTRVPARGSRRGLPW